MANKQSNSRIPLELQEVFLASNRGQEVHTPPSTAFRVFQSFFQRSKKPQQAPATTRGFFGLQRSRRSCSKKNVNDGKTTRRASLTKITSLTEQTCPVRDISFQCASPTRSYQTITTHVTSMNMDSLQDDVSVASSVTCSIALGTEQKKAKKKKKDKSTPQYYLDTMMKARGYTKKRCYAHECGYHNKTTRTQQLSYHSYLVDLVKDGKVDTLKKLFAAGLSTNPANVHGEGLINLVCRLGNNEILKVMIDAGCDVQVSDDYGRTPLHDACCATQPSFQVVELLLKIDPYLLFVMDVRGSLPLSYVQQKDHNKWIQFLQSHEHEIWPLRVSKLKPIPPLTMKSPNSRPVPEPKLMLPSVFIEMLASGRMSPEEVTAVHDFDDSSYDSDSESEFSCSDDEDDDDDEDEGDDEEEDDEDDDENEDEEVKLEDFDPDNCSFGHMSAGGYTYDFSESNHDSNPVTPDDDDRCTKTKDAVKSSAAIIGNLDLVKEQSSRSFATKSAPRMQRTHVRVTTALMKNHISSNSSITPTVRYEHGDDSIKTKNNRTQEIDLRLHCCFGS